MARSKRSRPKGPFGLSADLMLAPAVMAFRLPIMATEASGSNPWRPETMSAVTEKVAAVSEGMAAAQLSLARSAWAFWPEMFSGHVPSLINGKAVRLATDAALKPAGKRVRANYRRLSKGV